jgi:hypothetical protein
MSTPIGGYSHDAPVPAPHDPGTIERVRCWFDVPEAYLEQYVEIEVHWYAPEDGQPLVPRLEVALGLRCDSAPTTLPHLADFLARLSPYLSADLTPTQLCALLHTWGFTPQAGTTD